MSSETLDLKKIPGPGLRDGLEMIRRMRTAGMLAAMQELSQKFGHWVKLKSPGGPQVFLVTNIDDIYSILVSNSQSFIKGRATDVFRLLIGRGLPVSEGALWLGQRRLLQPMFHRQMLTGYLELMKQASDDHAGLWIKEMQKNSEKPIDLHHMVGDLTHDIVARSLFGVELGADVGHMSAAWSEALSFIVKRASSIVKLPLWLPVPSHVRFRKSMKLVNNTVDAIISHRLKSEVTHDNDLLSRLIQARTGEAQTAESALSNQDLRDQILAFLFAGHETTANNISWTLYLLLKNPKILSEVQEEIRQVFAQSKEMTLENLSELHLLRQVIYESLRLYPPAAMFVRESSQDVVVGDKKIDKGTILIISPYIVQRDQTHWPDPEKFEPSRFKDAPKKAGPQKFLAFGLGPRVCIGEQFAIAEAQIVIMNLLKSLDMKLVDADKVSMNFNGTLRPSNLLVTVSSKS